MKIYVSLLTLVSSKKSQGDLMAPSVCVEKLS